MLPHHTAGTSTAQPATWVLKQNMFIMLQFNLNMCYGKTSVLSNIVWVKRPSGRTRDFFRKFQEARIAYPPFAVIMFLRVSPWNS